MKKIISLLLLFTLTHVSAEGVTNGIRIYNYTTPIDNGDTFTGKWLEVDKYASTVVKVNTDQSGILQIDFSSDCSTETNDLDYTITANITEVHRVTNTSKCLRVYISNDSGSNQTSLDVSILVGNQPQLAAPLNLPLAQDSDATVVRVVDSTIDISSGRFTGFTGVNKFGRAPDGIQITDTDIWDRADSTPTQQIWTPPTQARVHAIVSSSDEDSAAGGSVAVGTGAWTIRVWGLTSWTTAEVSEDITMDGTTSVNTSNSYVIIHRMRVLTSGATASGSNVGTITATAAVDGTVTAAIRPTSGSTAMAIYGCASGQSLLIKNYRASINKAQGSSASSIFRLLYNPEPATNLHTYIEADLQGVQSDGSSSVTWNFDPYLKIDCPAIVKIQGLGSAADLDGTAGFNSILLNSQ